MYLSVLIPTYNREKVVLERFHELRSLINKSKYKNTLELLISENPCVDGSYKYNFDDFNSHDFNFKYSRQSQNIGAVKNIEWLVNNSSGKWIWIISDKDNVIVDDFDLFIEFLLDNKFDAAKFESTKGGKEFKILNSVDLLDEFTHYFPNKFLSLSNTINKRNYLLSCKNFKQFGGAGIPHLATFFDSALRLGLIDWSISKYNSGYGSSTPHTFSRVRFAENILNIQICDKLKSNLIRIMKPTFRAQCSAVMRESKSISFNDMCNQSLKTVELYGLNYKYFRILIIILVFVFFRFNPRSFYLIDNNRL